MDYVSASYLGQVAACPAAGRLPRANTTGPLAERGKAIHLWVAHNVQPIDGYRMPAEYQNELIQIDLEQLFGIATAGLMTGLLSEQAFIIGPKKKTARILGRVLDRSYGKLAAGEVPMTLDLLWVGENGKAIITDMKTGRVRDRAAESWQLKSNAVSVWRAFKVTEVTVQLAFLEADGSWTYDQAVYDEAALAEIEKAIVAILASIKNGEPSPSEDNCRYCPCYASCPATTALIRAAGQVAHLDERAITEFAGEAYLKVLAWEKAIAAVREQIEGLARREPIRLPDGRILREVTSTREYATPQAIDIAAGIMGPELAASAATTSKKALEDACKAGGMPVKQVMEALRNAGAFESRPVLSVKAVKE